MTNRVGRRQQARSVAQWSLATVAIALSVANLLISIRAGGLAFAGWVWGVPFLAVGWILWRHRPANMVGPLLAVQGVAAIASGIGWAYGAFTWIPPRLTPTVWPIMISNATQGIATYLLIVALVRFPTGHLVSQRWRWVERPMYGAMIVTTLTGALADPGQGLHHPWASTGLAQFAGHLLSRQLVAFPFALAAVLIALVIRFRGGDRIVQLQLKWLMLATGSYLSTQAIGQTMAAVAGQGTWTEAGALIDGVMAALIPLAIAAAVLRYRLYEIDRIISRTVTYGLVAAITAAAYAVPVIVLPSVIQGGSDLIVAMATLLAAAVFNPVRRLIQNRIDRRFNRARYEAQQEVNGFSAQLRDEIHIDELIRSVERVVTQNLSPAGFAIWTRSQS